MSFDFHRYKAIVLGWVSEKMAKMSSDIRTAGGLSVGNTQIDPGDGDGYFSGNVTVGDDINLGGYLRRSYLDNIFGSLPNLCGAWVGGHAAFEENRWYSWTPTYTGFSSDPPGVTIFRISGRLCTVCIHHTSDGTSNSTAFEMSTPVPLNSLANLAISAPVSFRDNGSNSAAWGMAWLLSGGPNTIKFYTDASGATATWTNSGGKRVLRFTMSYPI